jgi:outer membrane protein W
VKITTRAALAAFVALTQLVVTPAARAQDSGDGFLFFRPSGSWTLRGGYAMPNAGSDIFSFTSNNFTVSRADFRTFDVGGDLAFTVAPRVDLVFDISYSGMSKGSEYRNFVDNNNQPIQQSTSFQRTPITINARYYLTDRGRQVGHYAWIPNHIVPYVGAGVGAMYYDFEQKGDFIAADSTQAVYSDAFRSSGWAPMAQGLAGVEWELGPRWSLRTEVRYLAGSAAMSSDFVGFHRIDLSGMTSSVGFFLRF